MTHPLLELSNVTVQRETSCLLDHVSLSIPRGRHTAILGPNGSGKTSLLRILTRDYYPSVLEDDSQGEVRILGESVWIVSELRKRIGLVSSSLDDAFTRGRTGRMLVTEAIASGFTATQLPEFGVPLTPNVLSSVHEALNRVGESELAERRVETLSTGERRRVLIARALVHQPEILILDEPTSGLDLAARQRFLDFLRTLLTRETLTLLLVTHHIEEVLPEIGHVVLLANGRVVFDGAKEEAFTDQTLSQLFGIDLKIHARGNGYCDAVPWQG